jgi:hypothetical protein
VRSSDAARGKAPRLAVPAWLPWCAGSLLAAGGLFFLYLRQASTWRVDSDAAANVFQAWDMLHGNLLLHGWWVSDVSFFTTELPEYMLVETVRGVSPEVVHVCSALTYTLLVLLAALLAKGHARGREGVVRALLTTGMMLSPGTYLGRDAVLGAPNHTGTGVSVLLILLLIDRAEEPDGWKRRWPVPVAALLLLTWVQIADPLATYAAALPLALVGGGRAITALRRRRSRPGAWRYDLALTAAAAGSVPLARACLAGVGSLGGFSVSPVPGTLFGSLAAVPTHALAVGESILVLFGADFFGRPSQAGTVPAVLHLAVVAVAALALLAGLRQFFRLDRIGQVLVAGTIIMLAAGVFGTHLPTVDFAHEIAIVLPFGAVLAGRLLAGPLIRGRLQPVLAVGLAVYLGTLCYSAAAAAPAPPQNQAAADWLVAHHLRYGLAWYWQADSITLDSGGQVTVAPLWPGTVAAYHWEAKASWFDARSHYANFVVTEDPSGAAWRSLGRPAQTYHYEQYTIMVWHENLLTLITTSRA